ncbi:MAG: threonine synthase [Bacteroidales bacterium]|jgi:threonine synthase|nr:threonine synthase [Bacteroidales bacterium]
MKKIIIKYYSTNLRAPEVSFREALLKGLAPDGGLYMPRTIPDLKKSSMNQFSSMSYHEIAFCILNNFLSSEINDDDLKVLCRDSYNFKVPVEKVADRNFILRLDQGPTASFKDFAVRMMARLMNYFVSIDNKRYTILTATSGDTGSAVANAFHGLKNIDVIILFPSGEVSETQRKQMTTLHDNISVIAIKGKFDDCQRFVKRAFSDTSLKGISLSSANSINIGRLLPQSVYYFYAWSRIGEKSGEQVIFSVPSGNYGNLMGGVFAREMGLPVKNFIISANSNNEVPEYLRTGTYKTISPSLNCISSAMNVGHPSNFARLIALYGGVMNEQGIILKSPDLERMRKDFSGFWVTDEETRETILSSYKKSGVLLEPHGAVAWKGLESYQKKFQSQNTTNQSFISLETAHPAKFPEEIRKILGITPSLPLSLTELENKTEEYIELENNYEKLKEFILKH